jgi:hypothetical protein
MMKMSHAEKVELLVVAGKNAEEQGVAKVESAQVYYMLAFVGLIHWMHAPNEASDNEVAVHSRS